MRKSIFVMTFQNTTFDLQFHMNETTFESSLKLFKEGIMIADTYPEDPSVTLGNFNTLPVIQQAVMEMLITKVKDKADINEYINEINSAVSTIENELNDIETSVSYIKDEI